ncbi:DUF6879 family protein [Streptomyces sp. NBC_01481]|nr:DUF6879 family protein [Streptomyces sp. NBC_01481]
MGGEISEAPSAAKLCAEAFEAVWSRAIPHDQYKIPEQEGTACP